jgi:hypothetical protein
MVRCADNRGPVVEFDFDEFRIGSRLARPIVRNVLPVERANKPDRRRVLDPAWAIGEVDHRPRGEAPVSEVFIGHLVDIG